MKSTEYISPEVEVVQMNLESIVCISGNMNVSDPWSGDSEEEW